MDTKNILITATMVVSLAAVNADAAIMDSSLKKQKVMPGDPDRAMRQRQNLIYPPGIYRSTPYLSIVIVPESVDPAFEDRSGTDGLTDDIAKSPRTRLEPYRPAK